MKDVSVHPPVDTEGGNKGSTEALSLVYSFRNWSYHSFSAGTNSFNSNLKKNNNNNLKTTKCNDLQIS